MEIDMSLSCTVKAARRAPQTTRARLLSMAQCRWQHAAKEAGAARSIRSAKSPLLSLYLRACAWFLLPPHGMVCAAQHSELPWVHRKFSILDERYTKWKFWTSEGKIAAFFTWKYFQNTKFSHFRFAALKKTLFFCQFCLVNEIWLLLSFFSGGSSH